MSIRASHQVPHWIVQKRVLEIKDRHHLQRFRLEPLLFDLAAKRDDRRSSAASLDSPRHETYWPTLVTMTTGLIVGIGFAAALHGFYASINGTTVGGVTAQERSLRIGTALSFLAQISLVYSMRQAYVQWLWRELKRNVRMAVATEPLQSYSSTTAL